MIKLILQFEYELFDNSSYYNVYYVFRKPTTHKGKKFIINREPKLIENKKECLFLHGRKGSEVLNHCLKDLVYNF